LSFFNSHYDTWCYLPVAAFLTFNDEKEQYLVAAVLRPGNAVASAGAIGILRRILLRLWRAFPKARIRVRLDGGFADPLALEFLDTMGVEYVYGEGCYAARTWLAERRVIFKAEVVRQQGKEPKDNPRFVVTNLRQSPQWIYEQVYCQRGDIENRLKELYQGVEMGRTSCSKFWANQFRVLMTAAAYVLLQELRLRAERTACGRAQVWTLRERLLKLGAQVVVSVRRVVIHLPASFAYLASFRQIARSFGALSG
jgi:Transposase DDE domain group 1